MGRTRKYRSLVTVSSLIIPLVGTIVVYGVSLDIAYHYNSSNLNWNHVNRYTNKVLPRSNAAGQLVGLYMLYVYWAPYVCGLAMFQANTAGHTKKTTVNAMDYVAYAVGNIIGKGLFIVPCNMQDRSDFFFRTPDLPRRPSTEIYWSDRCNAAVLRSMHSPCSSLRYCMQNAKCEERKSMRVHIRRRY